VSKTTLLRNGVLISLEPLKLEKLDLLIVDGRVAAKDQRIEAPADCEVVDCRGRYIMPGFVDAHSHLYRSQTLGLPDVAVLDGETEPAPTIEDVLTPETIVTSAFAGAMDALSLGTTTLIDLHQSSNQIHGSLGLVRDTVLTVGPRLVSGFEIDASRSVASFDAALRENERFCADNRTERARGTIGLGALSSTSDEQLARVSAIAQELACGVQISCDENDEARDLSLRQFGKNGINRLDEFGLLTPKTIINYRGEITATDAEMLRSRQAWVIHSPSADALSGNPAQRFEDFGYFAALGSGGCRSNVFAESRAAFLQGRARAAEINPLDVIRMIVGGQQLGSELLGLELGSTNRDAGADFIILNYHARTPLTPETLPAHLIFGMGPEHITSVMIDGDLVYRAGNFPDIDMRRLSPLMRKGAEDLWQSLTHTTIEEEVQA
jgi:cytosine/adenosine deaminase-related metal-dependent hydrolase